MSYAASLADYRHALGVPEARWPVLTSLIGRLPIAMVSIAVLIYLQRRTGSFAIAGAVSAAALIGVATGAILQGRLIDRFGPTRPLLVAAGLTAGCMTALVLAVEAGAAGWLLVMLAAAVGATQPMVAPASRALWSRLTPPGPVRHAAYSYEAISMEVFFILGPAVAGVLAAAPWPGTALAVAGACLVGGAVSFALTPAVRGWRTGDTATAGSLLGAIATAGMRTVVIAVVGFGMIVGFIEVAVPAAATHAGHTALSGVLLGVLSLGSVSFGLLYSTRPWPRQLYLRAPALLAAFAVLVAVLAIPGSLLGLAVALLIAGLLITPQSTAHSALIEDVAPSGTATEAFGWVITAVTVGIAFGHATGGELVERFGTRTPFIAGTACGLALAAVVWVRRRSLLPAPDRSAV